MDFSACFLLIFRCQYDVCSAADHTVVAGEHAWIDVSEDLLGLLNYASALEDHHSYWALRTEVD